MESNLKFTPTINLEIYYVHQIIFTILIKYASKIYNSQNRVKSLIYKCHQREPNNVPFINSCSLYTG